MLPAQTPVPASAPALQPLLALGVEDGVFVIVAAPAEFAQIEAFARVESEPMPRLVMASAYLSAQAQTSGQTIYTAFIPWPTAPSGPLLLGCVTANKRKPVFKVDSLPYHRFAPQTLLEVIKRFGRVLLPALKAKLSPSHPLWQRLVPLLAHPKPKAVNDATAPSARKTRVRRKRIPL